VTAAPALGGPAPKKGAPAPKQEPPPSVPDAVIVGAGTAGIAAARRLAAAGRRFALIEAAPEIGVAASPTRRPSACPMIAAPLDPHG